MIIQIVFFLILSSVKTSEVSDIFWIGSSPAIRIPNKNICATSEGAQLIVSLENQYQNTHIVYDRQCGLSTISIQQNKTVNIKNYGLQIKFQFIILQPNTTYLWGADENCLYLLDVSQPDNIQKILKIQKEHNAGVTIRILFNEDKQRLILVNKFIAHLYNVQNPKNVKYVSAIVGDWEMEYVIISSQLNLIFVSEGYFRVLQIKNKEDLIYPSKPIIYDPICNEEKIYYSDFTELVFNKYLIIKQTKFKLAGINLSNFIISNNCEDLKREEIYQFRVQISKHILTPDKKYIISIVSFLAIQILRLEYGDVIKSTLFQLIDTKIDLIRFSISFDQQMIIISTQKYLDIYKRIEPNYKKIIPSLLNLPQNIVYEEFSNLDQQGQQCQFAQISKLIFYTKGDEGVFVFKENEISRFLEKQYQFTFSIRFRNTEFVSTFNNDKNLVIGRDDYIYLYNIENIKQPKMLFSTNFNNQNTSLDSGYITRDLQYLILSAGTEGVFIVNISDLSNPIYVTKIYHEYPESTPCSHISVSVDENYVFASYRQQGLVIYDVKNKKNPKILSYLNTLGGESTTLMKNTNFIIMSDRYNGLIIINVSDILNPIQISSIPIDGYAIKVTLIQNEEFALCVTSNRGQVALIDIRDVYHPIVLQKYQYKDIIGGFDFCTDNKQRIGYLSIKNAFVRLTLYPEWEFNLDIYLLTEGKKIINSPIDYQQTFQLGQTIKIKILQANPNYNVTIVGAKYYYQFKSQALPSWAFYSELDQSLTLSLDKNSITNMNDEQDEQSINIKQFIFEIKDKLSKFDFISKQFQIDQQLSENIFLDCINSNLINDNYQVSQYSQDIIDALFQQKYNKTVVQFIINTLKKKTVFYPILIKVESSLQASFELNSKPFIKSLSDYILIELSVDRNQAQFIETTYQGLQVYFNDKNDLLKIEGDISQINLLLEKGIQVAYFQDPKSIQITLTINDNINVPLIKTIQADQKYLIYLNKPVKVNEQTSLQNDFNSKFTDSVVYISESFTYTFSPDIFIDEDSKNIIYEANILIDGEYKPIPESFWLSFQSKERQFFGTTTTSMYLDIVRVMVKATDGFTNTQDYFVIRISGVPIRIVLITISQILGPIIGIFGLWRYQSMLYNCLYKKYYQTTSIKIDSGSEIYLQIPLLENQLQIAQSIWFKYYKSLDTFNILSEMNQIKQIYQQSPQIYEQKLNLQDTVQSQVTQFANSFYISGNKENSSNFLQVPGSQLIKQLDDCKIKSQIDYKRKQSVDQKRLFTDVQKSVFFEDTRSNQDIQIIKSSIEQKRIQVEDSKIANSDNLKVKASIEQKGLLNNNEKKLLTDDLKLQFDGSVQEEKRKNNLQKVQKKIVKSLVSKIVGQSIKEKKSFLKIKNSSKDQQNLQNFKFFNQNGSLNGQLIINEILCYYQTKIKSKDKHIIENLNNNKSKLSRIILGLAAISFSKLEKSTFSIVQYLKKIALQNRYTQNDWYKYYVNIITKFDKVYIDQFPELVFDDDKLFKEISILYESILNRDKEIKLLLPFLKEVISAYAYGFTPEKGGYVPRIRGECLEIKSHQIQSIRGYRPLLQKKGCFFILPKEILVEKELSMNQIIPSWIQSTDISNEVILIKGKTENKDVGEYILKIFDKNNFILKQIRIIIYPKKEESLLNYMEEDKVNSFIVEDGNNISIDDTPCNENSFPNSFQNIIKKSSKLKSIKHLTNQSTSINQTNQRDFYK